MSIITKKIRVVNKLGIHARPAALLVKLASQFASDIFFEKDSERVNAKSIMGVMMLAASEGSTIEVTAEGDDAQDAVSSIEGLFLEKFGEDKD